MACNHYGLQKGEQRCVVNVDPHLVACGFLRNRADVHIRQECDRRHRSGNVSASFSEIGSAEICQSNNVVAEIDCEEHGSGVVTEKSGSAIVERGDLGRESGGGTIPSARQTCATTGGRSTAGDATYRRS